MTGPRRVRFWSLSFLAALVLVAPLGLIGAMGASGSDVSSWRDAPGLTPIHVLGSDSLRLPTRLVVVGDELVVLDRYRREAVLSIHRRTGEVLRTFGRRGQGPAELWGPFAVVADADRVVVLDVSMNRLTSLHAVPNTRSFRIDGLQVLTTEAPVLDIAPMENGRFLALGLNPARPVATLDVDGRIEPLPRAPPRDRVHTRRMVETMQGVLRDNPLGFHENALPAARAVRCAGEQGADASWRFSDALVNAGAPLDEPRILAVAEDAGLVHETLATCLKTDRHDAAIQTDMAAATQAGLTGTPMFIVGPSSADGLVRGRVIRGAYPIETFRTAIDEALASASDS